MISIALLGPVEVRRDGELISVPAGKPTELLVRLALSAGEMVPKESLLEDLWGVDAVATSANTMQSKVSRLRKALGDPGLIQGGPVGSARCAPPASTGEPEGRRQDGHLPNDSAGVMVAR